MPIDSAYTVYKHIKFVTLPFCLASIIAHEQRATCQHECVVLDVFTAA